MDRGFGEISISSSVSMREEEELLSDKTLLSKAHRRDPTLLPSVPVPFWFSLKGLGLSLSLT